MNSLKLLREVGGKIRARVLLGAAACTLASLALGQATGPTRITLDEAIQMALQHNHNMLAARTTIQQSEAEETTANLRPNPTLFADWEYLPLGAPAKQNPGLYSGQSTNDYLKNNTEGDIRAELPDRARQETPTPIAGSEGHYRADALARGRQ